MKEWPAYVVGVVAVLPFLGIEQRQRSLLWICSSAGRPQRRRGVGPRRPVMSAVDGGSQWPERSIRPNAAFALGRANSGLQMRSGAARSSRRSCLICDRGRIALARLRSPPIAPISSISGMSAVLHVAPSRPIMAGSASSIRGRLIAIGPCSPKKTRSRAEEAAPADRALPCRGPRHPGCGTQSDPQDVL